MVNTFLPYKNFKKCAKCLDNKRLNKQITEAYQILDANIKNTRWKNHPAAKLWKGYERQLISYIECCIDEWHELGYISHENSKLINYAEKVENFELKNLDWFNGWNGWWLRITHKSNLFRKNKKHYWYFWYAGFGMLEYYWNGHSKITNILRKKR